MRACEVACRFAARCEDECSALCEEKQLRLIFLTARVAGVLTASLRSRQAPSQ